MKASVCCLSVSLLVVICLTYAGAAPILLLSEEEEGDVITTTFPPGPPQILSDEAGELEGMEMEDYEDLEDFRLRHSGQISVEIEAFVSQSPSDDLSQEERERNVTSSPSDYENIIKTLELDNDLSLVLTWWQVALIALGCLLVTCLCCYVTSCCYLSLDCCSDPYWGCCPCCQPCVPPTRPPHHNKADSVEKSRPDESRFSLNENSGAPRGTRGVGGSARNIYSNNNKSQSQPLLTNGGSQEERRPSSREREREGTQQSLASLSSPSATLSSVKSVRNYRRTTRPACQVVVQGERREAGLSESLPHVYQNTSGSYFSWLHLFGKSKRRYKVSRRKKQSTRGPARTQQFRQTRYRHIAEQSRNSAVIPTRIAKRSSTASNFNMRPQVGLRSRSAETVDELEDVLSPMLETVASERHLPRSRLSANLAGLQGGPGYNLRYFEKSLMKSKETTL